METLFSCLCLSVKTHYFITVMASSPPFCQLRFQLNVTVIQQFCQESCSSMVKPQSNSELDLKLLLSVSIILENTAKNFMSFCIDQIKTVDGLKRKNK